MRSRNFPEYAIAAKGRTQVTTATDRYVIHSSLRDDMNEGWIWIRHLQKDLDGKRRIVRVTAATGKRTFCEALYADDWYMEKWHQRWKAAGQPVPPAGEKLAFISSWYRSRLGIGLGQENLTIEYCENPAGPFLWQLHACFQHPQLVVVLATVLAVVGLGLGILAIGLGVAGVADWRPYGAFWLGWLLVLCGIVVIGWALLRGLRR
jgi:hypothetical protein